MIAVTGDMTNVEIVYPKGSRKRSAETEIQTGAQTTEVGVLMAAAAKESEIAAALRTLNTAEVTYLTVSQGIYASLPQLISQGLIGDEWAETAYDFKLSVVSVGTDFVIAALPVNAEAGRYGYVIFPDGVIRYTSIPDFAPPGAAGTPITER